MVRGAKTKDSTTMSGSMWLWLIQALVLRPENRSTVAISSGLIAFWNAWRADRTRSAPPSRTMARSSLVSVSYRTTMMRSSLM